MQNQSQTEANRNQKREQFVGQEKSNNKTALIVVALVVIVAGIAAYFALSSSDKPAATTITSSDATGNNAPAPAQPSAAGSQTATQPTDSSVKIPIADLSAKAKFFEYPLSDGRIVRFFAVKSADGVYRTALDACDVCYHSKKGYRQEGENMICNNCGLPFAVSRIGVVAGGCNPIGLPNKSEGDQLVINARELQSRAGYF
jgi:uncharacterized membrane protein